MVLQLLLTIRPLHGFLRLPVVGSRGGKLQVKSGASGWCWGQPWVGPLGSVLLDNDGGDVAMLVAAETALVSLQRAKDESSPPAFFSCVQATLGVGGKTKRIIKHLLDHGLSSVV